VSKIRGQGPCGGRADVAQPEHGRTVGDDGDGVALDRQPAGVLGLLGNRQAHPRDARGIGAGQIVAVLQRHRGRHLQLAAQVDQERPVTHPTDVHARDVAHRLRDRVGVGDVRGVTVDVDDHVCQGWDSTTSSAVSAPPAAATAVVSCDVALIDVGTSTRSVTE
jgi:hypothetical protein